ncbi:hypothetical protein C8J56DRAFT_912216, partial [Mycena floridula]
VKHLFDFGGQVLFTSTCTLLTPCFNVRHELGSTVYCTAFELLLLTAMQLSYFWYVTSFRVLYLYDFYQTISEEWEFICLFVRKRANPHTSLLVALPVIAVRYTALVYYLYIIYALATWTPSVLSSRAQILESIFLFSWTSAIWLRGWRVWGVYTNAPLVSTIRSVCVGTAISGLAAPIYGLAVTNPSLFPRCRAMNISHATLLMPTLRVAFDGFAATLYTAAMGWKTFKYRTEMKATPGLSKRTGAERALMLLTSQLDSHLGHSLIIFLLILEIVFLLANTHARNFVAPFVDSFSSILAVRGPLELRKMLQNENARLEETTIGSRSEVFRFQARSDATLASQPRPLYSGTFAQSSPAILCRPPSTLPDSSITLDGSGRCEGRQRTISAHAVLLSREFRTTPPGKTIALEEDDQTGDKALPAHAMLCHGEELAISRSHTQLPRVLRPYYYSGPISRAPRTRTAGFIPPPSIQHLGRLGDQLANSAIDPEGFEDTFQLPLADFQWRKVGSASMTQLSRPGIVGTDLKSKVKRRYSIS